MQYCTNDYHQECIDYNQYYLDCSHSKQVFIPVYLQKISLNKQA